MVLKNRQHLSIFVLRASCLGVFFIAKKPSFNQEGFLYLATKYHNMFYIRKSTDGQFFAGVQADNGEPLQNSETIQSKQHAKDNIVSLVKEVFETFDRPAPENHEIEEFINDLTGE